MLDRLVSNLAQDQDRKAFVDWTPPSGDGLEAETGETGNAGEKTPGPGTSQEVDLDAIEDAMSKIGQKVLRRRPGPDRA